MRSQGGNSARFASLFSGASISAASVQPPPPGVQPATGVSQTASSALPVSSASHVALGGEPAAAGHVAAGGGPTATPWVFPAWYSPSGWMDLAPPAKKARSPPFFIGEALPPVP